MAPKHNVPVSGVCMLDDPYLYVVSMEKRCRDRIQEAKDKARPGELSLEGGNSYISTGSGGK